MSDTPAHASEKDPLSPRTKAVLALIQGLLPAMTAIVGALWIAGTYLHDQRVRAANDEGTQTQQSQIRLLEAQKAFLQEKLRVFVEAANVAGKIVSTEPDSAEWDPLWKRFWSLRWSEMEMVGNPKIRQRMRAVADAMSKRHEAALKHQPDEGRAHYLRWMVECLADELRRDTERA
jgi:hypothetical protein